MRILAAPLVEFFALQIRKYIPAESSDLPSLYIILRYSSTKEMGLVSAIGRMAEMEGPCTHTVYIYEVIIYIIGMLQMLMEIIRQKDFP